MKCWCNILNKYINVSSVVLGPQHPHLVCILSQDLIEPNVGSYIFNKSHMSKHIQVFVNTIYKPSKCSEAFERSFLGLGHMIAKEAFMALPNAFVADINRHQALFLGQSLKERFDRMLVFTAKRTTELHEKRPCINPELLKSLNLRGKSRLINNLFRVA